MINHRRHSQISNLSDKKRRRGAVLVWFAVFMFALLPLLTLIVHMGTVTLTRRQMQMAVDTAAIEGLRFQDDQSLSDTQRRERVRDHIRNVFDDNLNAGDGDPFHFGAGPIINIDNGITLGDSDLRALTLVSVPDNYSYKPILQLNTGNQANGDMVRGFLVNGEHDEGNDYLRGDFDPDTNGDAFLVRLRRTNDPQSLDSVPNTSSSEGPIPFLFGHGPYGGTEFLNRRERGTIVRATAIAHAEPAMTAGPYSNDVGAGTAPIWIEVTQWNSLIDDIPTGLTISGTNILDAAGITTFGEFVDRQVVAVGDTLNTAASSTITGERIIPIYFVASSTQRYVIGFGIADVVLNPGAGTGAITRRESRIGESNVGAFWKADLSGIPAADLNELLANRNTQDEPLLAPALVRTME